MKRELANVAIFGALDGLISVLGVVVALALGHRGLATAVIGLAVASAVGMGAGQALSDDTPTVAEVLAMVGGTVAGTIVPAIPVLCTVGPAGWIATGLISAALAGVAGRMRGKTGITELVVAAAVGATIVVTLLTGAA